MKTPFIIGQQIYLRPLEPEDLNTTYLGWLNDPEVAQYLESGIFPSTQGALENFYNRVVGASDCALLAIASKEADQHIGNVKLEPIDWVHRKATFGILVGDKQYWGKGVGVEATRLMVEYGFSRLNLNRIELGVYAEHQAAVRAYERVGFRVEGRLRENMFLDNEYRDSLLMGLLRSEYHCPIEGGSP